MMISYIIAFPVFLVKGSFCLDFLIWLDYHYCVMVGRLPHFLNVAHWLWQ